MKAATTLSGQYTTTHSIFTVSAENVTFTLDFFSPIEPDDYIRQSIPFSYLTITAAGNGQSVQVYSDIDNSWTGQGGNGTVSGYDYSNFTLNNGNGVSMFTWEPKSRAYKFAEVNDMAQWGNPIYATTQTPGSTHAAGDQTAIRAEFASDGTLHTFKDTWAPGAVTAFAHDLGHVNQSTTVLFTVGYVRDDLLQYLGTPLKSLYRSKYSSTPDVLRFFIEDYNNAVSSAKIFDAKLLEQAVATAGTKYADIVTLSVRQMFGAWDFVSLNGGTVVFQKEISSNGNINTLDVIFPLFPAVYVIAPQYIRLLLEPVVQYLATGRYPEKFAIHDIGWHYPNATGHDNTTDVENMPIEECGNLLLLTYAYETATKDTSFKQKYRTLFDGYADYLVQHGLYPADQLSTDDFAGNLPNQTNLAIKAAVALNAWGKLTGNGNYSDTGKRFAKTIYEEGLGTDKNKTHFVLQYHNESTWMTSFNLYPDVLFKLDTFPKEAIDMQSRWYPTKLKQWGVPLESRLGTGKSDWMIFSAAIALGGADADAGKKAFNMFIDTLHSFLSNGLNTAPFSDWYNVTSGRFNDFRARPVAGGHFALLAMNGPDTL